VLELRPPPARSTQAKELESGQCAVGAAGLSAIRLVQGDERLETAASVATQASHTTPASQGRWYYLDAARPLSHSQHEEFLLVFNGLRDAEKELFGKETLLPRPAGSGASFGQREVAARMVG